MEPRTTFVLNGSRFLLRRAVEEDLSELIALLSNDPLRRSENSTRPEDRSAYAEAFREIERDPGQLLIAVEDETHEVVATLQLTFTPGLARRGAKRMTIEAVRVHERLRGNGLGSSMIEWAVAEGKRRGAAMVQLTSDRARTSAHRFYERLGFTQSHLGFKLILDQ